MRVTLDTNCIVDLELVRQPASALKKLIIASSEGIVKLMVSGISASEKSKGGGYSLTFSDFQALLSKVGLDGAEVLMPIGYYGVTYYNFCLYPSDEMLTLERKIHEILFPKLDLEDTANSHWRNAKCDVLGMWCHIYYKGDIFVTGDRNFHKESKKPRLIALGAKEIVKPKELGRRLVAGQ